jgi:type I restriction enzyme R subunit
MSIKNYTEADTRANFIDPALLAIGWLAQHIRREYYFTDGRKLFGGRRGERCRVDYLLIHHNTFIGIIEAKAEHKEPTEGLQQVINYAKKLNVRFVFSTNGKSIYEFDVQEGKGEYITAYPTPDALYQKAVLLQTPLKDKLLNTPFYISGDKPPRYYQEIAVQKVMEGIAEGKNRLLLTLATGTGKTVIAFQIVHKLLQAKWNIEGADRRPRILFLADRNVLVDQAMNTFNPYEKDIIKINGDEIRKRNGIVPTNAYIFFAIYQAISEKENIGGYYQNYPSDFFDAVIIDECHRGSANEEGSWRAILEHFKNAVHIGLTATPKKEANIDTYNYFGKPLYEYSLKEGINDGFLTPYKVKRIRTSLDEYIYTGDDKVVKGEVTKDVYGIADFDRNIIIPQRTAMVAKAILEHTNTMDKTIIFCVDQTHALAMRDAINQYKTVKDPEYCVRITSDEGWVGRQLLERFQDNDKDIPVILTSSQMLTTGVDARNVRNIVLCRTIGSVVEFKQIIGRGTRVYDGKDFFTIIDFTGATNLFYDDEWDGPAEQREEIETGDTGGSGSKPKPPKEYPQGGEIPPIIQDPPIFKERLEVQLAGGRKLKVIDVEVRYIAEDGRPLSAKEFLEQLLQVLPNFFESEEQLRSLWSNPDERENLLKALGKKGFDAEQLETLTEMFQAKDSDYFDVLAYLAFSKDIITRQQRADAVKADKAYFDGYQANEAKQFLKFILNRYQMDGFTELNRDKLPQLIQLNQLGTPKEAANYFGGFDKLVSAYYTIQSKIYHQ